MKGGAPNSRDDPAGIPPPKDNTVLYLVIGLGSLALVSCLCLGCGVGGVMLFRMKGPFGSFGNANLSEANMATISNGMQTGMTLDQVNAIIGTGSVASQSEIDLVNKRLGKFGNAVPPAPAGKTKYVWKSRSGSTTQWLFIDADNSTRRISSMTSYTGPN